MKNVKSERENYLCHGEDIKVNYWFTYKMVY